MYAHPKPDLPILIVSDEEKPTAADMLLSPKVSIRRLINRVELYSPLDKKRCFQRGDIYLDKEKQRVFTLKGFPIYLPRKFRF